MDKDGQKAVKLPVTGKRNILITSALPYVNNEPHLGNIIGCVLSADVFARYCRLRGYVVLYVCGTDEYGTATETKALQVKKEPKEICDQYHAIHKEVYEWFGISFDKFGRTSTPQHTQVCHAIFKKLWDNKYISERTEPQLYCDTCDRFLADRLVEGICPTPGCNSDSARGDECKKCDKLLSKATDLINPRCKECKSAPRERDTKHLYLKLPDLEHDLRDYIEKTSEAGSWSKNAITTTDAWLRKGLEERSITRDLKWGVPVPVLEKSLEEYKDKVFYVWFDAPVGYMSITSCYTQEWEAWWKNPENVELYQFMGKDNVPFHTVMFPSTLIGTKEKWTMMKTISVTEYLRYETGKFSKSEGVGVFGNVAKDTKIPVEVWRYYLLANRPETSDTLFTWADLQAKQNNELKKKLGNFIYRVLSFIANEVKEVAKKEKGGYSFIVPDAPGAESHSLTKIFGEEVSNYVAKYVEALEKVKLKEGLKNAMSISNAGNAYLQKSNYWEHYKNDRSECSIVVKTAVGVVYILACLLEPFMPSFSKRVLEQLNLQPLEVSSLLYDNEEHWKNVPALASCKELGDIIVKAQTPWDIVPAGHTIGTPEILFKELKDKDVEILRNKFAGSQAERAAR